MRHGRAKAAIARHLKGARLIRLADDDGASVHALANVVVDLSNHFHLHARQVERTEALACVRDLVLDFRKEIYARGFKHACERCSYRCVCLRLEICWIQRTSLTTMHASDTSARVCKDKIRMKVPKGACRNTATGMLTLICMHS
jgi:hypothetical protein